MARLINKPLFYVSVKLTLWYDLALLNYVIMFASVCNSFISDD